MMQKYFVFPIVLILVIIFACENYDHTPPEVTIDSPNDFAPVFDITLVEITATDDEEMSYVELFVDGEATGLADSSLPYIIEWNTYQYENKSDHLLVVRAWDASENYTDSESIRVLVDNTAYYPSPINVINIIYEDRGFTLTWSQSGDDDFAAYQLKKFTGSLMDSSVIVFESNDIQTHTYRDTMIDPLVQYYYRITVIDSFGLATTGLHNLSPTPAQYAPTGLYTSTSENTIKLRWNDNTPFELGFRIERDDGTGFKLLAEVDENITGYTDDSLQYDIQYRYRVAAYTATNQTEYSQITSIFSPLKFAPSDLAATTTDTTIILSWRDNALFEEGFRLERSEGTGYTPIADLAVNVTTFTDYDLEENVYYTYRVAAFTSTSQSDYSFTTSIWSPLKFAPSALTAFTTGSEVTLRWTDNCIFEDGFRLERDEGQGFIQIAELATNTTGYTDTNLVYDVSYRYRVAAFTSAKQSNYSNTISVTSPLQFAPSNLSATAGITTITLEWTDNSSFEDGFIVERRTDAGYVKIAELERDSTIYVDSDLEEDEFYSYRVAAFTASSQSDYSSSVSIFSPIKFAPTSLTATTTDSSIVLRWADNSVVEDGFKVERDAGLGFIEIAEVGTDTTAYIDVDLAFGVQYRYRVRAFVESDLSNYSATLAITSPLRYTPTGLIAIPQDTSILLIWDDNSIFEDGFRIERSQGIGFTQIAEIAANITSYADSDIEEDIFYTYRIAAFTATDQSDYSSEVSIQSPISFAPTNLSATAQATKIILNWTDNSSFEDGYKIERDEGSGFVEIAELRYNYTTYTDDSLDYDVLYSYRVKAFTSEKQSEYTEVVTIQSPIVLTPSNLSATAQDNSIILRWQDNSIVESGFRIERDAGSGFIQIAEVGTDTVTYTDSNIVYGIEYRYRVSAFTATSVSDFTAVITITSPLEYAPSNLTATAGDTTISLQWTDNCNFEEGFRVERDAGTGFIQIAEVGSDTTTFTDTALQFGVEYSYRVAAFTSSSQSDYTSEVLITSPLIFAPTGLSATVSNSTIQLEWVDDCIFEDGFRIERNSGSGFAQIAEIGPNATTYSDNYLAYNTEYEYRVAAFDGSDQSAYTDIASATIAYLGMEWVTVTGGDYTFGETDVVRSDLGADFEIMKFEVTNAQYVAFLEEVLATFDIIVTIDSVNGPYAGDGSWAPDDYLYYDFSQIGSRINWNGSYFTIDDGYENHPVVAATWFGAYAFAQHYGWNLPTEYEWEKAARGNTGFDYPWGDEAPTCDLANYSFCNDGTIPVGQTSGVSPYGAYDMIGNAWEWINTFDGATANRTIRGGSWSFYTENLTAWSSLPANPKHSYYLIGFRCIR